MNSNIRTYIINTLSTVQSTPTHALIAQTALHFGCTRHKVSGNISYMVCHLQTLHIEPGYNGSIVHI